MDALASIPPAGGSRRVQEIALAFPRGAHQELFVKGVLRYAREHECEWSYLTPPESLSLSVLELEGWPGDGILAALNTPRETACAASLPIPVVNISSALRDSPVPRSIVDNYAIGTLASEHLISRAFPSYAFYGLTDIEYSEARHAGFRDKLALSGRECAVFLSTATFGVQSPEPRGNLWLQQHRELAAWLEKLATPCGLFAVSDYRARQTLDACRRVGLKVPEQVAVIGVDNEQVICEHSHPSLTSVARNDQLEGYRAAELLHALMQGRSPTSQTQVIRPLQVVLRESTATFAASDERLQSALSFLHAHLEQPITIEEVTQHASVSRRWLEYAFREILGQSPYQYLRRQRLAHARRLLADEPNAKIYAIARRTGFSSAKQLTLAFQQQFGMSPREYRRTMAS